LVVENMTDLRWNLLISTFTNLVLWSGHLGFN
jgi:hypothetical protein